MAEFNKGYYRRQGKMAGIYLERERIIKLVETYHDSESEANGLINAQWVNKVDLIALIKGEK